MMLGETVGLKGRATRAGEPVSALDPAALTQRIAVMPFHARWVRQRGCHFYFARRVTFQPCADTAATIALLRYQTISRKRTMQASASNAPPSGDAMRRPHEWFFSAAIINPSTSIQPRFPAPTRNITSMSAQQHPTQ
jgi:hypothetical protein